MKKRIITIALMGFLISTISVAQENVKKAFDKFVASKNVQISKSISEERDFTKDNLPLIAKADVYNFTMKQKHRKLIDEVLSAFEKDRNDPNVYSILTHHGGHNIPLNTRELLVGNERKNSIYIGMDEWQSWQLICLLDPADKTRSHRYAYAIEWNDDPKQIHLSGKIRGKLVVTYSVIPNGLNVNHAKSTPSKKDADNELSNENIIKELYKMGVFHDFNGIDNKTQFLMAFEALKTTFMNDNAVNQQTGTIAMTMYALCSNLHHIIDNDVDLRKKLISDLNMMIKKCDKNSYYGKSHIGYLELAIKSLQ